jgi:hypothetical protein
MTEQITPLRQRMLDDMALRNMSPATQRGYINAVKSFSEPESHSSQMRTDTTRSCLPGIDRFRAPSVESA